MRHSCTTNLGPRSTEKLPRRRPSPFLRRLVFIFKLVLFALQRVNRRHCRIPSPTSDTGRCFCTLTFPFWKTSVLWKNTHAAVNVSSAASLLRISLPVSRGSTGTRQSVKDINGDPPPPTTTLSPWHVSSLLNVKSCSLFHAGLWAPSRVFYLSNTADASPPSPNPSRPEGPRSMRCPSTVR